MSSSAELSSDIDRDGDSEMSPAVLSSSASKLASDEVKSTPASSAKSASDEIDSKDDSRDSASSKSVKRSSDLPPWCDALGNIDIRDVDPVDTREIRIYLDGVFDCTHYGHYRLFKNVKDKFPNAIIVVGVSGDEETIRLKGHTVMDESERAESIAHCKWVDEVICPCIWIINDEYLAKHNIDYVAHDGDPYVSADSTDIYDFVKRQGKFIATQRTDGISTTGLINRIVRRYNEFILRNLRRGVPRDELELSWTREKRIKLAATIKESTERVEGNIASWMEDPTQLVDDFLLVFGPRGKIADSVKERVEKMKSDFVEYAQFAPM
jgi:choline-phosphate cytidylyltransferase